MKHYFRILILLLIASLSGLIQAHDQHLATVHIRRSDAGRWLFELMTPLPALDQAMRASLPEAQRNMLAGSTAYKEAVVAYVKKGFAVSVNGRDKADQVVNALPLSLGQGRLRLDEHVSTLQFEIKGMPAAVEQLEFSLAYMADNPRQNNFVRLIDGDRSKRYILNVQNNFSGKDSEFFAAKK